MSSSANIASVSLNKLQGAGFDRAACTVAQEELHELSAELGENFLLRTGFETDVSLLGINAQRRVTVNVNQADDKTVNDAVQTLNQMTDGAKADEAFDIAPEQPYEHFAAGPSEPDYDLMYERVSELKDYARANYPTLNLRSVGITFHKRRSAVMNSNGVHFDVHRGYYQAGISFSSREGTDNSSMMYTGYSALNLEKALHEAGNVDELMRQSTEQVRTRSLQEKFKGDMIIAPDCLATFLGFLTQRIGDSALISGTSVFQGKLNEQVTSPLLTLHCRPGSAELATGYSVTGDGFKAQDLTLLEEGILRSYLLGLYGANKTGLVRALNSGGCHIVEPGIEAYEDLVAGIDEGVLLTRFSGGRPNDKGDFSGVAKNSYYIKHGRIQYPLKETTVSGNMVSLLKDVQAISRERINYGHSIYPWMLVNNITVS